MRLFTGFEMFASLTRFKDRTKTKTNKQMQLKITEDRIPEAVETEMPIPVRAAIYATMHRGHLGINRSNAEGKNQPKKEASIRP